MHGVRANPTAHRAPAAPSTSAPPARPPRQRPLPPHLRQIAVPQPHILDVAAVRPKLLELLRRRPILLPRMRRQHPGRARATECARKTKANDQQNREPRVGDVYRNELLSDYVASDFWTSTQKLAQLAVYDTNRQLVRPWAQYDVLQPGTVVLVKADLEALSKLGATSWSFTMRSISILIPAQHFARDVRSIEYEYKPFLIALWKMHLIYSILVRLVIMSSPHSCVYCHRILVAERVVNNEKGNGGRMMVRCSAVNANRPNGVCGYFRWLSSKSPSSSPTIPPSSALPSTVQPPPQAATAPALVPVSLALPPLAPYCGFGDTCKITRISASCTNKKCRRHCLILGGCAGHGRQAPTDGNDFSSNARLSPTPIPPPASPPFHFESLPRDPSPPPLASQLPSRNNVPRILDASANPRYARQMPPIFTQQIQREQEIQEEKRLALASQQDCAQRAKHTISVFAWIENGLDPTITAVQDGFVWPHLVVTPSLLDDVGIDGRAVLYDHSMDVWVNIKVGHIILVHEGDTVFLKAYNVTDLPGFQAHRLDTFIAPLNRANTTKLLVFLAKPVMVVDEIIGAWDLGGAARKAQGEAICHYDRRFAKVGR
ncbi:hypothetical protein EYR38_002008 [Pleurotus pulmonarius]|nr:hypothetical protein EYR38_002008 [Pleurotus pulmonarius]